MIGLRELLAKAQPGGTLDLGGAVLAPTRLDGIRFAEPVTITKGVMRGLTAWQTAQGYV